jgi:hypothetical protein
MLLGLGSYAWVAPGFDVASNRGVTAFTVPGRTSATPWIAADGELVAVAWGATGADRKTDVFVAISRDGGASFDAPVQVNSRVGEARVGGQLPPRVAVTRRAGSVRPEVVVLWTAREAETTIKLARSADGGATLGAPVALQTPKAAGDRGWPSLALDVHGVAHGLWLDHRGLAERRKAGGHAHHHAASPAPLHDGAAMAQHSGLYYAATRVAARPERELAKGVCYCCKTALAVGTEGQVYAAWRHVYPGNIRDIAFMMSRDGGRSFTEPVRVSKDEWEINGCPEDGPSLAVDARGTVHVVWPTLLAGDQPEGALFYASTRDGRVFTPRLRIPTLGGPKPTHPQLVVDAAGRVVVAWEELLNGRRSVGVREIAASAGAGARFGPIVRLGDGAPATFPVLAATGDSVLAVWTSGAVGASTVKFQRLDLPGLGTTAN